MSLFPYLQNENDTLKECDCYREGVLTKDIGQRHLECIQPVVSVFIGVLGELYIISGPSQNGKSLLGSCSRQSTYIGMDRFGFKLRLHDL